MEYSLHRKRGSLGHFSLPTRPRNAMKQKARYLLYTIVIGLAVVSCGKKISILGESVRAASIQASLVEFDAYSAYLSDANPDASSAYRYELVSLPTNGTLAYFSEETGGFIYRPDEFFHGTDKFVYRLTDGKNSAEGTVDFSVSYRLLRFMNPVDPLDVNQDGLVSHLDYDILMAFINDNFSNCNRVDQCDLLSSKYEGPPSGFYDTSGDNNVTALDVLTLINGLNQIGANVETAARPVAQSRCRPGSVELDGLCFYLSQSGESCDKMCRNYGGCQTTATLAIGSGAEDSVLCTKAGRRLLQNKNIADQTPHEGAQESKTGSKLGCHVTEGGIIAWDNEAQTSCEASAENIRRICSCRL